MSRCAKCWDEATLLARSAHREVMVVYAEKLREHDHSYPPAPVQSCRWEQDEEGNWWTQCEEGFVFGTDGPQENGFRYCPYCGGPLITEVSDP